MAIKLKVGPKGQVVIPKILREAYGIKEGGEIIVIPEKDGLVIKGREDPDKIYEEILKWKRNVKGKSAKLGGLRAVELEEEFD